MGYTGYYDLNDAIMVIDAATGAIEGAWWHTYTYPTKSINFKKGTLQMINDGELIFIVCDGTGAMLNLYKFMINGANIVSPTVLLSYVFSSPTINVRSYYSEISSDLNSIYIGGTVGWSGMIFKVKTSDFTSRWLFALKSTMQGGTATHILKLAIRYDTPNDRAYIFAGVGSLSSGCTDATYFLVREDGSAAGGTSQTLLKTWYAVLAGSYDTQVTAAYIDSTFSNFYALVGAD